MSAPEVLGRLRRVRLLGAGGFASVWLYRDDELDSDVAVKLLAANWAARPDVRERFLAESRMLRATTSAHLVSVFDVGVTDDGSPYFVMTCADAGTVSALLTGAGLEPARIVSIITQAAEGLAALHARDIVHRDIKPANLLLSHGDRGTDHVLVADLGVAKSLSGLEDVTGSVGTPAYMAPEQWGQEGVVDARSDVYSLGAVAWALVAGSAPPVPAHAGEPLPSLTSVRSVPAVVDQVVQRALAPDPAVRWPDVRSFADALARAVAGTLPAQPPLPTPRGPRTPRRPSGLLAALVVLLLAVVAVGVVGVVVLVRADRAPAGGVDNAYAVAAERYVNGLRAEDCATVEAYAPPSGADDPCDWSQNLHHTLAECIEPDTATVRVEQLGEKEYRVIFAGQGYVVMSQRAGTTIEAGYMVGCLGD